LKNDLLIFGTMLIAIGIFFTFITFGLGIVCLWPLILIGLILIIFGIILPNSRSFIEISNENKDIRYCKYCGKKTPVDAKYCPYCGTNIN
jgi:ribosomal protein L40E